MKLRNLFLVVCLLLLTGAEVVAGSVTGNVIERKLPNGLTVLMKEVHAAPVVTAQIWFRTGSASEHTGITGISHLLEHMLFNSSKNFKKGEITRLVQEYGGIENGATAQDFTYYWNLMSSDHLDFGIRILAEKSGNALIKADELSKERGVVLSEIRGYQNEPDRLLYDAVNSMAFTAHSYRWPIGGWETDVANVPREEIIKYYNKYYHPNNATLVLVGDFNPDNAFRIADKYFGSTPKGNQPKPVYTTEPVQRGEKRIILNREGSAERVLIAYHIPAFLNKDTYALSMLDQILSGGRASRLYQSLVETKLASGAWSSAGSRHYPGLFYLGATAMQGISGDKLELALMDLVENAKNTLPTEMEMQSARNQIEASTIFQNDSVSDQGEQLGYYNTIGSWKDLDKLMDGIKKVTAQQVQSAARKYLVRDNMTVGRFVPVAPGPESQPGSADKMNAFPDPQKDRFYRNPATASVLSKPATSNKLSLPNKQTRANLPLPKRYVLDNGLVLLVYENHSNPTVAVNGTVKAGACFDQAGKSGTADLTANMLSRGTQTKSALEIAFETEFVGASISFSASDEQAEFGAQSLVKDFDKILGLVADQLKNPVFPENQFAMVKQRTLDGIEQSKESTDAQAFRILNNTIFPKGHPYHSLTFDEQLSETSSITRDDLIAFHKAYYRPDTITIAIVGDVIPEKTLNLVKSLFEDWKSQGPKPVVKIPLVHTQSSPQKIVVNLPDKREVTTVIGYASEIGRKDPDYYAYRIMNQIIGGSGALGSILGEEIREKRGLVYGVYSGYTGIQGPGSWYATLGTSPEQTPKALSTMTDVIEKYKKNGPTQAQFENARRFIVGVLPIALETNSGMASFLTSMEDLNLGMDYLRRYPSIYGSVTLDQVKKAAKRYLHPEKATVVIVGSYKDNGK